MRQFIILITLKFPDRTHLKTETISISSPVGRKQQRE